MHYRNYTVTLSEPDGTGYPLLAEAEGDAPVSCVLQPPGAELQAVAARLNRPQRNANTLRDGGSALFRWLLPPTVRAHLGLAWASAERAGHGLRLRLTISPPEFAAWPWELLHDPVRNHTFAVSLATPLVRYLPSGRDLADPVRTDSPLDLLLVLPAAPDLDLTAERRHLHEVAGALGHSLQVRILEGIVTRADFADALLMGEYEIVHFGGHAAWARGMGYLALNRPDGEEDWLDGEGLARLVSGFRSLRLLVLNACNTGQGVAGDSDDGRGLQGLAPQLVTAGVPAVVAMQHAIGDAAAATFAREFYKRLLAGEEEGRVDIALAHARTMLAVLHSDGSWVAPVLYTSTSDGVILTPRGAALAAFDPVSRRERLAALAASLQKSAGYDEDWVLAEPGQLAEWQARLEVAASAYREHLDTGISEVHDAAAAGLMHIEERLAALERAFARESSQTNQG
jgi:hypothetical protein